MLATLNRMMEKCDPYIFYRRVRPFFGGWPEPGLVYEGVSTKPRLLIGGSAAQSALVQALDVGLDVTHDSERTGPFLQEMRRYMPRQQRAFLRDLGAAGAIRPFVQQQAASWPQLSAAYDACLTQLAAFRQKHIEISVRYIVHQAPDKEEAKGTGGTSFVPFLSESRKETVRQKTGPGPRT
jgi:indoleamine 2,3-dioxygenase